MEPNQERPTSFDAYVAARGQALLRLAFLLTGDQREAEDLTQTTLLRVMVKWRRVNRADDIDRYVFQVMLSRHVDARRRRSASERPTADLDGRATLLVADHAAQVDDRESLRAGLLGLSAVQRSVLVLRYYLDYADVTISDLLGIPPSTVRSHAARGLKALRRELGSEDDLDIEAGL
jgi:RNA polymerase sigma-70 factor (sigma-E family)